MTDLNSILTTDFKRLVGELKGAGIGQNKLCERLNCSKPTMVDIASGKNGNPKFDVGVGIIQLHKYHVTDAPKLAKRA